VSQPLADPVSYMEIAALEAALAKYCTGALVFAQKSGDFCVRVACVRIPVPGGPDVVVTKEGPHGWQARHEIAPLGGAFGTSSVAFAHNDRQHLISVIADVVAALGASCKLLDNPKENS
jgi:hypothetical protein